MQDLKVLLISDGRPGHFHLSEGIAAAMARRRSVQVVRLHVRRRRLVTGHIAAGLIAAGLPPRALMRLAHGLDAAAVPAADVIVSAGAETMPANVAAARLLGVPNIFYGSLRSFQPQWFQLVLTSYAAQARVPHPVMTLKPSRLDPDSLPPLASPSAGAFRAPRRAGLLVGGDGGGTRFAEPDWNGLTRLLEATHAAWGTRWIVSNSPRTPAAISDRLAARAAAHRDVIETFIDVRVAGAGTLGDLFSGSELIAVTSDSSSMLSEAVWSRRPVIALEPAVAIVTPMEAAYRKHLIDNSYCRAIPIAQATPEQIGALMSAVRPLARNPLDQLATLLSAHLPRLLGA